MRRLSPITRPLPLLIVLFGALIPGQAAPTPNRTAEQVLADADVIVAVKFSQLRVVKMDGKTWGILDILASQPYRGHFTRSRELWLEYPYRDLPANGFTYKYPNGPEWCLFFLRRGWWGRFSFAAHPADKGEIPLPRAIDPTQFSSLSALLIQHLKAPVPEFTRPYHREILSLLAALDTGEARQSLRQLSTSSDPDLAGRSLLARIHIGDSEACFDAIRFLRTGHATEPTKTQLEKLTAGLRLPEEL